MVSTRVEAVLREIESLTPREQADLQETLPGVLRLEQRTGVASHERGLTPEALQRAHTIRERIRTRLLAEGKPLFDVVADLAELRESVNQ